MDEDEFDDYDREVELALYREYRDIVSQFKYGRGDRAPVLSGQ